MRRQRVAGLAHNAFAVAEIAPPPAVARALAAKAQQIARQNLQQAVETARLQGAFEAAGIPVIVLKGIVLAQLAYGSLNVKHSKDIDLMVPHARAQEALAMLEADGYVLVQPARRLNDRQRAAALRFGVEFLLVKRAANLQVELRWRLMENPLLLAGADPWSHTRDVVLSETMTLRSLDDELLFAYLCAHGAGHGWYRLKWLADVNALVAPKSEAERERLFRYAQKVGSGVCAGQALLLCERQLQTKVPVGLANELHRDKRLSIW